MNRRQSQPSCLANDAIIDGVVAGQHNPTAGGAGLGRIRCYRTPTGPRRGGSRRQGKSSGRKKGANWLMSLLAIGGGVLLVGVVVGGGVYLFMGPARDMLNRQRELGQKPEYDKSIGEATVEAGNAPYGTPHERRRTDPLIRLSNPRIEKDHFGQEGMAIDYTVEFDGGSPSITLLIRKSDGEIITSSLWSLEKKGTFGVASAPGINPYISKDQYLNWDAGVEMYCIVEDFNRQKFKVSNSLTYGANSSITAAIRRPTKEEEAARKAAWEKEVAERVASRVMPEGYLQVTAETPLVRGAQLKWGELENWYDVEVLRTPSKENSDLVKVHRHGFPAAFDAQVPRSELIVSLEVLDLLATKPDFIRSEIAKHEASKHSMPDLADNVPDLSAFAPPPFPGRTSPFDGPSIPGSYRRVDSRTRLEIGTSVKILFAQQWKDAEVIEIDGPRMVTVRQTETNFENTVNRTDLIIRPKEFAKLDEEMAKFEEAMADPEAFFNSMQPEPVPVPDPMRNGVGTFDSGVPPGHEVVAEDLPLRKNLPVKYRNNGGWSSAIIVAVGDKSIRIRVFPENTEVEATRDELMIHSALARGIRR
ncbi:MAG: hypothetical protein KDA88_03545 [Planctomycetaceae bacterium]|nr:hypothetical protein [Planctomycetaceae bacterium]MCB9953118.1 hypothetical protein [Planctomycetaceae bacterium]